MGELGCLETQKHRGHGVISDTLLCALRLSIGCTLALFVSAPVFLDANDRPTSILRLFDLHQFVACAPAPRFDVETEREIICHYGQHVSGSAFAHDARKLNDRHRALHASEVVGKLVRNHGLARILR